VLSDTTVGGFTDVLVVKDKPSHEALRSVHRILRSAGRDDLVLIYYAGHGKLDRAGRLHLATTDTTHAELETTSIPAQRIRDLIDNADATKIALILDCCYSGAIDKSFLRGDVSEQLNLMAGGRGTFIMTASTDVQTAREEVRDGYGIFTKHLIDGMRGAADHDGDGVVTMNELYDYVHRQVLAESHQVPMRWNLNVEGEMIIARTGRKPREERRLAIRTRLFELCDGGLLPDVIFTKALEISNLSHEEARSGAAASYDALLDRVLDEKLRVGEFVSAWLRVPSDEAPKPVPPPPGPPKPQPEPARHGEDQELEPLLPPDWRPPEVSWFWKFVVFPRRATQENLDRHPLYRLAYAKEVRAREMVQIAAGKKLRVIWSDVVICIGWLAAGLPFMVLAAKLFESGDISYFGLAAPPDRTDASSGGMTGAVVWAVLGWIFLRRASHRANWLLKGLYWIGIAGCLVIAGAAFIAAAERL
jgi:hypothetical protein